MLCVFVPDDPKKCSAVYETYKKTTCRYCFYDAEGAKPQPFKCVLSAFILVLLCFFFGRLADRSIGCRGFCRSYLILV